MANTVIVTARFAKTLNVQVRRTYILTTMRTVCFFGVLLTAGGFHFGFAQWAQFGGPAGDFTLSGAQLSTWPQSGPRSLWKRALGEGYSGIAVDGGMLYTMYRKGDQEVATAIDAVTGKSRWEFAYDAPSSGMALDNGPGPHATPLVTGDKVFTIGIRARMYAFDKRTGKPVWTKDLWKDFPGSTYSDRSYSASPVEKGRLLKRPT